MKINSLEYECWHEAGHAVMCLIMNGKVEFVEILGDSHEIGRARSRCEVTSITRKHISCGGYASEYHLYITNQVSASESEFVKASLINAHEDKIKFFGDNYEEANQCWPAHMDKEFQQFAISCVYPVLVPRIDAVQKIAQVLLEKGRIEETQIDAIFNET